MTTKATIVSFDRRLLFAALAVATSLEAVPAFASETATHTYDARGRLTNTAHAGSVNNGLNQAIGSDAAGNRSNVTVTGATPLTCTPGTSHRYAIIAGTISWTVPVGVNCVTVYAIGAGGNGQSRGGSTGTAQGGGGGSFAKLNNYGTTPGGTITVQVAAGGSTSQTWWVNSSTLLANAGGNGAFGVAGTGGTAGVGDTTFAGGSGGTAGGNGGGGGGGAAGPDGAGQRGGNASNMGAAGGGGADGLSSSQGVDNISSTNGSAGGSGPGGAVGGTGASGSTAAAAGTSGSGGGGGGTTARTGAVGSQYGIWSINAGPSTAAPSAQALAVVAAIPVPQQELRAMLEAMVAVAAVLASVALERADLSWSFTES